MTDAHSDDRLLSSSQQMWEEMLVWYNVQVYCTVLSPLWTVLYEGSKVGKVL